MVWSNPPGRRFELPARARAASRLVAAALFRLAVTVVLLHTATFPLAAQPAPAVPAVVASAAPNASAAVAAGTLDLHALVSTGIASQYLWRGRDFTFAAAPVAITEARLVLAPAGSSDAIVGAPAPPLVAAVELRTINAIARRGAPWEARTADTVQLGAGGGARFLDGGWLAVGLGVNVSFYYGALIAGGASHGLVGVEPYLTVGFPNVSGDPTFSAVGDLTPDQIGFRSGVEWFPEFETGWGGITGYVGLFRPHNYLKQKSRSFVGELLRGQFLTALVSLIPSDVSVGATTLIPLAPGLALEPAAELMLVLNRPQNPAQIVPAATATLHYGAPEAIQRVRNAR